MNKKSVRDNTFKQWLKRGGREGAKKDFLTLLKRVVSSPHR